MSQKKQNLVIASRNPVKVEAALRGFRKLFPGMDFEAIPVSVPSGVADQPLSDRETLEGAVNRVDAAFAEHPGADYWIGIEGGVEAQDGELASFAWVVVRSAGSVGKARSGTFFLPGVVAALVAQGMELGQADDLVFNKSNSKQDSGAIGLLTGNAVDRTQLYEQAVALALVRFKNEALYRQKALAR